MINKKIKGIQIQKFLMNFKIKQIIKDKLVHKLKLDKQVQIIKIRNFHKS